MPDPLAYVGIPDGRSALLAAAFSLPWLVLVAWGALRGRWLWLAVAVAALAFPLSIAWVQLPIQQAMGSLWLRLLAAEAISRYLLLIAAPSVLVASVVQEGAKLLIAALALRAPALGRGLAHPRRSARDGLALGAAAGAGYGGLEAFWVMNQIFALGWSWATVQLVGVGALLGFAERILVVPFHIGATALACYGYATGRPWRFLLLAIALHSLANYAVVLLRAGLLGIAGVQIWVALVAAVTMAAALWLRYRRIPKAVPAAFQGPVA